MKKKFYTTFIFCVISSILAKGAIYKHHPYSTLTLGGGFNPFRPSEKYRNCIQFKGISDNNNAMSTEVEISFVQSTFDLYKKLHFSTVLEGSFLFLNGQSSLDYLSKSISKKQQLSWVILFRTRFGKHQLIEPQLKEQYKNYQFENLIDVCGSEIVTEERRAAMIYAIFTFDELSAYEKSHLKAKIGLNFKGPGWNASLKSSYENLLESIEFSQNVSISIHAIGGNGVHELSEIVGNNKIINYQKLPKIMHDYIANLRKNNAVPFSYSTTQISSFTNKDKNPQNIFNRKSFLKIYNQYHRIEDAIKEIDNLLYNNQELDLEKINKLKNLKKQYQQILLQLEDSAASCFNRKEQRCLSPNIDTNGLFYVNTLINGVTCEKKRKDALKQNLIKYDFYLMAKKRNFVPIIHLGKVQEWIPCHK